MDPASLAIGVLPLALNIAQLCSAVRKQRSDYKSSSTDIQSILDKIELIGLLCTRLEIELRSSNPRLEAAIIEPALKRCYSSVSNVNHDLEKVSSQKEGRKRSLQYVFNKFHIDRSLSDLNDSIQLLSTCMSMSACLSPTPIKQLNLLPYSPTDLSVQETTTQPSNHVPSTRAIEERRQQILKTETRITSHRTFWYFYELVTTCIRDENDHEESTRHSYLVGSPLLGAFVSVAMRYGPLSPLTLTLDAPVFVYEKYDKSRYDAILRAAPNSGAASQDVARWVADFNIKPNMHLVRGYDDCRYSLLGFLVAWDKPEAFKYLVDRVGQQCYTDELIKSGIPWTRGTKKHHELLKFCVDMRGPLFTLDEYVEILIPSRLPVNLIEMFDYCADIFADEMEYFVSETMYVLVMKFISSNKRLEASAWFLPLSKLLSAGLDVHESLVYSGSTALFTILTGRFKSPPEILECAEKWIEVMRQVSIDVDDYLYVELLIRMKHLHDNFRTPEEWLAEDIDPWYAMSVRMRLEIIFDMLHPGLRVPLFVDYESADNLLQIMPALCYDGCHALSLDRTAGKEPSHLDWKRNRKGDDCSIFENWPFLSETSSVYCLERGFKNITERTTKALASHDVFLQLINTRFERRQQKKWQKLKLALAIEEQSSNAPGGWPMEWWEYQGCW